MFGNIFIHLLNDSIVTWICYSIVAFSLFGQFSLLRMISLTLLASISSGAYLSSYIYSLTGTNSFTIPLVSSLFIGATVGWFGHLIHKKIGYSNKVIGLLGSLGFYYIIQGIIVVLTGGGISSYKLKLPTIVQTEIQPDWLLTGTVIMFLLLIVNYIMYNRTKLGRQAIAVGDDYELASLFGISCSDIELKVQIIGGAIGGLAGIILALDAGLKADLGFSTALKVFAILIIAKENLLYIPVISFVLSFIEKISAFFWGGQLSEAIGLSSVVFVIIYSIVHADFLNYRAIKQAQNSRVET